MDEMNPPDMPAGPAGEQALLPAIGGARGPEELEEILRRAASSPQSRQMLLELAQMITRAIKSSQQEMTQNAPEPAPQAAAGPMSPGDAMAATAQQAMGGPA